MKLFINKSSWGYAYPLANEWGSKDGNNKPSYCKAIKEAKATWSKP